MLGKLLKHEFVATGRVMLPVLAAVTGITLLANLMLRFGDVLAEKLRLLMVLFVLVVFAAVVALIAAEIMTIVLMVLRFHHHLLGSEGYLTHALPVSVHGLVWSKLIVSAVWIIITNLLAFLLVCLSVVFVGRMNLGELLRGFPSWNEILLFLEELGISRSRVTLFLVEFILGILLSMLSTCLHFYAAMSLGHMFSKDKVLLSIVFFVGISIAFGILNSVVTVTGQLVLPGTHTAEDTLFSVSMLIRGSLLLELIEAGLLYAATVLGLKKGLNLA